MIMMGESIRQKYVLRKHDVDIHLLNVGHSFLLTVGDREIERHLEEGDKYISISYVNNSEAKLKVHTWVRIWLKAKCKLKHSCDLFALMWNSLDHLKIMTYL